MVREEGIYYVYSQVRTSRIFDDDDDNRSTFSVIHFVSRYNEDYPLDGVDLLMQNTETPEASSSSSSCGSSSRKFVHTSYLAGIGHLSDILFVEVSNSVNVEHGQELTFVG